MAIRQRGSRYQVDVKVKNERVRVSAPDREAAIRLEADIRAKLLSGKPWDGKAATSKSIRTLKFLREHTWREKWRDLKSGREQHQKSQAVLDILGADTDIRDIDGGSYLTLKAAFRARGNSNATINRKASALSAMLTEAVRQQWITSKPYYGWLEESQGRERQLSLNEENGLLRFCREAGEGEYADLFSVAINTGARMGELTRMLVRDVDLLERRIHINGSKTGKKGDRSIPIWDDQMVAMLQARIKGLGSSRKVFNGISKGKINTVWNRARAHMGLSGDPAFVPHVMRHTCACRLAQAGVPLGVVKLWLGHRSYATTLRYARYAPENLTDAAAMLSEWQGRREAYEKELEGTEADLAATEPV